MINLCKLKSFDTLHSYCGESIRHLSSPQFTGVESTGVKLSCPSCPFYLISNKATQQTYISYLKAKQSNKYISLPLTPKGGVPTANCGESIPQGHLVKRIILGFSTPQLYNKTKIGTGEAGLRSGLLNPHKSYITSLG